MKPDYGQGDEPSAGPGKAGRDGRKRRLTIAARMDGDRQDVPAEAVRELCLDERAEGREVFVGGARIVGQLDLSGRLIDRFLQFSDCEFTDSIDLRGARASAGIHLEKCKMRSLYADRLSVHGDLVLERVCSDGLISLCGAQLTGHLRCTGSKFSQPSGKAFNAKGIAVEGSALFDGGFSSAGEFILAAARIHGTVDMTDASFSNESGPALTAQEAHVGTGLLLSADFKAKGMVLLREARISGVMKCSGGHFSSAGQGMAIDAELIEADEVYLDKCFKADGKVSLDNATVTGRLNCNGGSFSTEDTLSKPKGVALSANGLDCRDVRLGHGFTASGEVQLMGAVISRELNCTSGRFDNEKGTALHADGMRCDGKVYLNESFCADGEVKLHNSQIRIELNCSNGTFNNSDGAALSAGGLTCGGNVYLNEEFKATGRVELMDATIGGELNCEQGEFGIFHAQRLEVSGTFDWQPRPEALECVDVSFANVGLLLDRPASWPANNRTRLVGFTFRDLDLKTTAQERIKWLETTEGYAPDIYQQLVRTYRQKGRYRDSRSIAIAGQVDRRKRGEMPLMPRMWNFFLWLTVGYGYKMQRALYIVVVWGLAAGVLFLYAQHRHVMEAVAAGQGTKVDANVCTVTYPCFVPFAYSFEMLFPVINLRQLSFWLPSAASWPGRWLLLNVWLAVAAGWALSIAVAAGIGHLFSERN